MHFILGILLVLIIIFMVYNFMYISISDAPNYSRGQNGINSMCNLNSNAYSMAQQSQPQPMLSKSLNYNISSLSNKQPIYDYNKYFFTS